MTLFFYLRLRDGSILLWSCGKNRVIEPEMKVEETLTCADIFTVNEPYNGSGDAQVMEGKSSLSHIPFMHSITAVHFRRSCFNFQTWHHPGWHHPGSLLWKRTALTAYDNLAKIKLFKTLNCHTSWVHFMAIFHSTTREWKSKSLWKIKLQLKTIKNSCNSYV